MERILEPELMDESINAEAYAAADFSEVNQAFVDRFLTRFPEVQGDAIIDLGCGPAEIPIRLCRALPLAQVTALDGSAAMLELAAERLAKEDSALANRIRLVRTRLPSLPADIGTFGVVLSNSLLHHLPDPGVFWKTVSCVARPNAAIFVVDLMRPRSRQEAQDLVDRHARDESEVLRTDFFNSLLAAFTLDEIRAQVREARLHSESLANLEVEAISDRHLAITGVRRQESTLLDA